MTEAEHNMSSQIKLRRDTAANWTSVNPKLALGEPGLETDTLKIKYGNGTDLWNILQYAAGGGGGAVFSGGTVPNPIHITDITPSTISTSGALVVDGGVGIGGNLYAGDIHAGDIYSNGVLLTNSGGGSLSSRNLTTGTTSVIDINSGTLVTINGYKSYLLQKFFVSTASWVTVYSSMAAATADASRTQGVDPTPGSGVIAEIITAASGEVVLTPGVMGFNDESPPTTDIIVKAVNLGSQTQSISITLRLLQLEI